MLEAFRKTDLLDQAYKASIEMLNVDEQMFEASINSLRRNDTGEIGIDIYQEDIKINKYERDVRRKVLAHLATHPTKDLVFGLILVSIVIDIERIGDYTKNILELALNHPRKLRGGTFEETIADIEMKVVKRFQILKDAFQEYDVEKARSLMQEHRANTQRCDKLIISLIKEEHPEITPGESVTLALYVRFLKRISSHLTNIASAIVNPFDRIGFKEEQPEG